MDAVGGTGYALGHSEREIRRLSTQAEVFGPFTKRMFEQAGISTGMRVLDVGSGSGDVAFLCAELTGPSGQVVGVERSPAAVETARARAQDLGLGNVTFVQGDAGEMPQQGAFDAIVGRLALMHQPDPAGMLRKLSRLLGAGGIVVFQEFDISGAGSYPPAPTFEQCMRWISAAFEATGTDSRMGVKLYSAFVEAGLPAPAMSLDAGIWGAHGNPAADMVSDVIRSLLPALVRFGIATQDEVGIDTLRERVDSEIISGGGVAITPSLIGAWTRLG